VTKKCTIIKYALWVLPRTPFCFFLIKKVITNGVSSFVISVVLFKKNRARTSDYTSSYLNIQGKLNTEQLKKKVTHSRVYNEVTSEPTITRYTTIVRKTLKVSVLPDTERLLLWSRHFATRPPLAAVARNSFPRQLQTNFQSFPNNCWTTRDCRLAGYSIINMWKCYLLFELLCISENSIQRFAPDLLG
jgi:hypothetical protein